MNMLSRQSSDSYSSEDDLTVNIEAKVMKDQFTSWYSAPIQSQLDLGVVLGDVDVDQRLSVLKPIHATWIVSMYNHCLLYTSPSPRDQRGSRMPSSA